METAGKGFFRKYFSILGLKITAIIASGLTFTILFAFWWLEGSGLSGETSILSNYMDEPALWMILASGIIGMLAIISKVLILPIKNFEIHLRELSRGNEMTKEFTLSRRDELGYMVSRFNELHRIITEKLEDKSLKLSIIHEFMNSTAGVFTPNALMECFFNTVRKILPLEIGMYSFHYKGFSEDLIFSTFELDEKNRQKLAGLLKESFASVLRHMPAKPTVGPDVVRLEYIRGIPSGLDIDRMEEKRITLYSYGKPVGVILLMSFDREAFKTSRTLNAIVHHTNMVLDRIIHRIFLEERRLNTILSTMEEGVYIVDKYYSVSPVNQSAFQLLRKFCKNFNHSCLAEGFKIDIDNCPYYTNDGTCEFAETIRELRNTPFMTKTRRLTKEVKNRDGMIMLLSIARLLRAEDGEDGYVITAKDITEERRLQEKIFLSSKLTAIGEMAAGIAHEINNPLQIIMGNIELLEQLTDSEKEEISKKIRNIREGTFRIKNIVHDLLIFARDRTTEAEVMDINTIVEKSIEMMKYQFKTSNIVIHKKLDTRRALNVKCNRNLLQQVIINLLQNSKDAIEEHAKGSRVSIKTELSGGRVSIEITDDGPGIPESIMSQIFDLFFTTKEVGKGTGLGLGISRKIIEDIGGEISVVNTREGGARFRIVLPYYRKSSTAKKTPDEGNPDLSGLVTRAVLMVDDEQDFLETMRELLQPRVFLFDYTTDGKIALDKVLNRDYDFLLLDLKMPEMSGKELYKKVIEHKPYMGERIIFLTGDTESESSNAFLKLTGCKYLAKPFSARTLLNLLSDQLNCYG